MVRVSFDFCNSATTSANVKRCYGVITDVSGFSVTRLFGNVLLDFLLPNVSAAGITWNMTGSDDPVVVGSFTVDGRLYVFDTMLCYNETATTWRLTGTVRQCAPENLF